MSGNTTIVQSSPGFVVGTYGAKAVRNANLGWLQNRPGLAQYGDFSVVQRGAGANMSVDIGAGGAYVYPATATRQGPYYVQSDSTYNTSSNGGYTWTAADPTNPRIDLVCLEVKDNAEDASGSTGLRFRVVDGTPNASATHQLATTYWPAVPTGCVPIAAIKVPATATTLTTANITNLNPVAGPNQTYSSIATAETTTSASLVRLTTPDAICVYVPHANCRVRVQHNSLVKGSTATPTFSFGLFCNDVALKQTANNAAPGALASPSPPTGGGTFLANVAIAAGTPYFQYSGSGVTLTADSTNVATGMVTASSSPFEIRGLASGWYCIEVRFAISTGTLSAQNRYTWAEVIG